MNKGINDLFKLIENETSKSSLKRKRRDFDVEKKSRSRMQDDQFSFQPKINK